MTHDVDASLFDGCAIVMAAGASSEAAGHR